MNTVHIYIKGPLGCGKSAIAGEIEILCKALGLSVSWLDGQSEKNMTGADWQSALDAYKPNVVIHEVCETAVERTPSGEAQSYRDANDMPMERAVLEREWLAMRLALSRTTPPASREQAEPAAQDHIPDAGEMVVDHFPDATKMIETAAPVGDREAFEREMRCEEEWGHRSLKKRQNGQYENWQVDLMWAVWQARAALSAQAVPNPWRDAVIEQLESWHIYVPAIHENSPRLAIKALVNIETQAALDPKVSSQAAALAAGAVPDERDKVDAQRYRWLADCNNYEAGLALIIDPKLTEQALGAAIDAAILVRGEADPLTRYRVWPDGTVQEGAESPYTWMSDDFEYVEAVNEEQAALSAAMRKDKP